MTKQQAKKAMDERILVEGGEGEDHDAGHIVSIDGKMAIVAWKSGVRTPCSIGDLSVVGA